MHNEQTLVFIDGENIWSHYKEMVLAGKIPKSDNVIIEDCFVWNQSILEDHLWNIRRISYYTSLFGGVEKIRDVRERIADVSFTCTVDTVQGSARSSSYLQRTGQITPVVIRQNLRSNKAKFCDLAIAVDVMRACYQNHAGTFWIFSGDHDFLKLFNEIVHNGKYVCVSAFTTGLDEELKFAVDEFIPLDDYFFK